MATDAQRKAFVASMAPYAVAVGQKYGIDPKLIIAQSGIESDWGNSSPHNVYFGVKGQGPYGGVSLMTHENVPGKGLVAMPQTFRSYPSMEAAVQDYGNLIGTSPRYAKVIAAKSLSDQAYQMAMAGYANNGDYQGYANSITGAANGMDLSKYGMTPPTNIPNVPPPLPIPRPTPAGSPMANAGDSLAMAPVSLAGMPPALPLANSRPDGSAYMDATGSTPLSLGPSWRDLVNGPGAVAPPAAQGPSWQSLMGSPAAPIAPPSLTEAQRNAILAVPSGTVPLAPMQAKQGGVNVNQTHALDPRSVPPIPLTRPPGLGMSPPALPISAPSPAAPPTVNVNGHVYEVGKTYFNPATGNGFQFDANGTPTKTFNKPDVINPALIQAFGGAAVSPAAIKNDFGIARTAITGAASSAAGQVGGLLSNLFGSHRRASLSPDATGQLRRLYSRRDIQFSSGRRPVQSYRRRVAP
jgi:flagellar protein FlgJ